MHIIDFLFFPTSENPREFSAWCVLVELIANKQNYS